MNSHTSVAETHTHACARMHTHSGPPRIIHVSNCCVSPVLSFVKVNVAGMILHIITWLFEATPPSSLCYVESTMWKKKKKKITSVYVFGEARVGVGGWLGSLKKNLIITFAENWVILAEAERHRGGTQIPPSTREGIKTAHGSRLPSTHRCR